MTDPSELSFKRSRRDCCVAAFETLGCALATLRRLDHIRFDDDLLRTSITTARAALSVAQSTLKQKIDAPEETPAEERTAR